MTPLNVHVVLRVVHETPPGEMVTVYSTVPATFTAGHEMVSTLPDDAVAFALVGTTGSGTVVVVGATVVDVEVVATPDAPATRLFVPAVPTPTPFTALTDTAYVAPSVRPVSVHVRLAASDVQPAVAGDVVTW